MSPAIIILFILLYFAVLVGISKWVGNNSNSSFFVGAKKSKWYIVSFGMIGASLSGVTFLSVPGTVALKGYTYFQMVIGYVLGYIVIAEVLIPLYYRLNLHSIYAFLGDRFGKKSQKTGASFFLLSRVIGASFRLYLVALVFQMAIFEPLNWNVPFWVTVVITIVLIWLYTFQGGISTIVWTDTFQTLFMLSSMLITCGFLFFLLKDKFHTSWGEMIQMGNMQIFDFKNFKHNDLHFFKQFFGGAFIALTMTGLDQDMMQKNLSCKNIKEAKTNIYALAIALVFVNLAFLFLGSMLSIYAQLSGVQYSSPDHLFARIALFENFPIVIGLLFILGLIAAAYSSADSALTSLTTSFCLDILGKTAENLSTKLRYMVHAGFSVLLVVLIIFFQNIHDDSIIVKLFKISGYTYGPLLGLFFFGIVTTKPIRDRWVPLICLLSPVIGYLVDQNAMYLIGYQFGFELIIFNGFLTFLGLWLISKRNNLVQ